MGLAMGEVTTEGQSGELVCSSSHAMGVKMVGHFYLALLQCSHRMCKVETTSLVHMHSAESIKHVHS